VWLVRHGERVDDVVADWVATAARPFDPPLTEVGATQAFKTGPSHSYACTSVPSTKPRCRVRACYLRVRACVCKPGARLMMEDITQVYSSPFLRCAQTAHHIIQGIKSSRNLSADSSTPSPASSAHRCTSRTTRTAN
jgi:broad specificity phosphatase PhoE